jgi:hypothetical protein
MKKTTKFERLSAGVAAVVMTVSIVWAISGYAYPGSPSAWLGQVAKRISVQSSS